MGNLFIGFLVGLVMYPVIRALLNKLRNKI